MVDTQLTHPTYKFVSEQEADAFAWVFVNPTDPMKRVAIKLPEVKPNELRINVTYAGLCHSDIHTVKQDWGPVSYPIAPGHEIVGRVTHIGSDVEGYQVGDVVGFGCQRQACGSCYPCTENVEQLCEATNLEQKYTYADKYWGGYATALQQPADFFFKVPTSLPEDKVPPLFCAGVTTYAPIARHAKAGQNVAVLGIGGLGHMAVMYAKAWGCNVTAFTTSKDKEEFIKKLGADRVVVTNKETLQEEANKYHVVLNTLPGAEEQDAYVNLTKTLGTFVQLGIPSYNKTYAFHPGVLAFRHINYTGSGIGSRKEIREMLEFSAKHNIVPLCEKFDFENFPQAFDRLENGKPIFRCVVDATNAQPKH